MQIDKQQIMDLIRAKGDDDQAQQADRELPEQVDTDAHGNILRKFGLDPQELIGKLTGGGGGGLGGLLGGDR